MKLNNKIKRMFGKKLTLADVEAVRAELEAKAAKPFQILKTRQMGMSAATSVYGSQAAANYAMAVPSGWAEAVRRDLASDQESMRCCDCPRWVAHDQGLDRVDEYGFCELLGLCTDPDDSCGKDQRIWTPKTMIEVLQQELPDLEIAVSGWLADDIAISYKGHTVHIRYADIPGQNFWSEIEAISVKCRELIRQVDALGAIADDPDSSNYWAGFPTRAHLQAALQNQYGLGGAAARQNPLFSGALGQHNGVTMVYGKPLTGRGLRGDEPLTGTEGAEFTALAPGGIHAGEVQYLSGADLEDALLRDAISWPGYSANRL